MNIINLFFDTINFLTIIPIGSNIKRNDYNYFLYIFFPLVGLVIGVIYASFLKLLSAFFPLEVSILFALTIYIVLADFFHLDGFSDTIDALFASFIGKNPKDVLKDPHIGSMGVLFLILLLFIKFLVLKNIVDFYKAIVLSIVISRWSMSVAGFYGKSLEISFVGKKFIYNDFKILLGSLISAFIIH
ncbi:MAG: adenosylcobinamide-GDP ribazoletransferase, partial [Elusimicrobiota bacterium]|nr:adenosylcobinamide-GDP ribazoletransferase [Endomicrobiia bacterium]MDW8166657.1 adenosylcobinamide-GDP ribazoletransferase [Elusimicrobiota bacterium]